MTTFRLVSHGKELCQGSLLKCLWTAEKLYPNNDWTVEPEGVPQNALHAEVEYLRMVEDAAILLGVSILKSSKSLKHNSVAMVISDENHKLFDAAFGVIANAMKIRNGDEPDEALYAAFREELNKYTWNEFAHHTTGMVRKLDGSIEPTVISSGYADADTLTKKD